jgi:hypothetical protein
MVSKLLLAVAENFVAALESGTDEATVQQLGDLYYRIRKGIGFNKTPMEYGAFPVDPYSHTPKHAGARQPGMTGQVKEEILTRCIELGVRVENGETSIRPALLRRREFADTARSFCYLDVDRNWQTLELPAASLAFTWCQVPFVYVLGNEAAPGLEIELDDGTTESSATRALSREFSTHIFERTGRIRKVTVTVTADDLFGD